MNNNPIVVHPLYSVAKERYRLTRGRGDREAYAEAPPLAAPGLLHAVDRPASVRLPRVGEYRAVCGDTVKVLYGEAFAPDSVDACQDCAVIIRGTATLSDDGPGFTVSPAAQAELDRQRNR